MARPLRLSLVEAIGLVCAIDHGRVSKSIRPSESEMKTIERKSLTRHLVILELVFVRISLRKDCYVTLVFLPLMFAVVASV